MSQANKAGSQDNPARDRMDQGLNVRLNAWCTDEVDYETNSGSTSHPK